MKPCDTCLALGTETCDGCTVMQTHVENTLLKDKLRILEAEYKATCSELLELTERNEKITLKYFHLTNEYCQVKYKYEPKIAELQAVLTMCAERFAEIEKYAKEQSVRDLEEFREFFGMVDPEHPNQDAVRLQDEAAGVARQAHDMAEFCKKLTEGKSVNRP